LQTFTLSVQVSPKGKESCKIVARCKANSKSLMLSGVVDQVPKLYPPDFRVIVRETFSLQGCSPPLDSGAILMDNDLEALHDFLFNNESSSEADGVEWSMIDNDM
jgi:hypothetical protein